MTTTPPTDIEALVADLEVHVSPPGLRDENDERLAAALEALRSVRTIAGERDEAMAQRDELDFLLHEGGTMEAQLRSAEDERDAQRRRAEEAEKRLAEAERVIEPFAEFARASGFDKLPANVPLTSGSPMARKQVTVAEFRAARDFINKEAKNDG